MALLCHNTAKLCQFRLDLTQTVRLQHLILLNYSQIIMWNYAA